MSAVQQQMNIWEQKYHDIMELYALNEELLATVETAANPEEQMALVEPVIEAVGDSADILTEEYIAFCDSSPLDAKRSGRRAEMALRRAYGALADMTKRARDARNHALLVAKKIKRQLEQVIAHFVEFTSLSLDRIMHKTDVEELRARHANLARALGLGQGA